FVFLVEHEARDGGVRSKGEDEIFRGQGGTDGDGGRELVVLLVELRRESGPAAGEAVLAGSKVIEAEAAVGTGDRLLRLLALLGECDGYFDGAKRLAVNQVHCRSADAEGGVARWRRRWGVLRGGNECAGQNKQRDGRAAQHAITSLH